MTKKPGFSALAGCTITVTEPIILSLSMVVFYYFSVPQIKSRSDAENYQQYIQFTYECQEVKGQYSHQELEVRFNALAWNAIWKRDTGFRDWVKRKEDSGIEVMAK